MNLITGSQLGERLKKICQEQNWSLTVCPENGFTGVITFNETKHTTFRNLVLDINPHSAGIITMFKSETNFFLNHYGFSVPKYLAVRKDIFKSNELPEIDGDIQFPCIVKPNTGTEGNKVQKVASKEEVMDALVDVFTKYSVAVIQDFAQGGDYRVVVLNDKVVAAYQRIPIHIVGDGVKKIAQLLNEKLRDLNEAQKIGINTGDIKKILSKENLGDTDVLPVGQKIFLSHIANLSAGGLGIDLTEEIHENFKRIAIEATKAIGLKFCGVDIIADDITKPSGSYAIIEMNSCPGLENFACLSPQCNERVDSIYLSILNQIKDSK